MHASQPRLDTVAVENGWELEENELGNRVYRRGGRTVSLTNFTGTFLAHLGETRHDGSRREWAAYRVDHVLAELAR